MPEDQNVSRDSSSKVSDQREESWAQRLGNGIEPHLNKNILEVILEKDFRGGFSLSDTECAKFLVKLGLDLRSGEQIEGLQVCPNGRGIVYITLKETIDPSKFYRFDVIEVSTSGIRATQVRQAGKRDVTVTIKGIHPNTRDDVVLEYLEKFGNLVTRRVVYGVFQEGPLKGIKNGDRCYRLEIKPGTNLGSYHVLDGQKVTLRYSGQQQTCGRCLQTARECKGNGLARKCEAEGGLRKDFGIYIAELWERIGYSPRPYLNDECDESYDEVDQQVGGNFTPVKCVSSPDKFTGVSIRRFPKDIDDAEIMEFLAEAGLAFENQDKVQINKNGVVNIMGLLNTECHAMIQSLHQCRAFSRTLYCNGIIPITPEKGSAAIDVHEPVPSTSISVASEKCITPPSPYANMIPKIISPLASPSWPVYDTEELCRRNSLSLINRTPPPGSLAAELLGPGSKIMSSLTELRESLSDFNSCISSDGSEAEMTSTSDEHKKRKRKKSPGKQEHLKKANLKVSPEKILIN